MKKNKISKLFILSLFIISCFSFVSSTCETSQIIDRHSQLSFYVDGGYTIAPITIPEVDINEDVNLWFRVYDDNAKVVLTNNDLINCSVFLFSPDASRIYRLDGSEQLDHPSLTGRRAVINSSFINETGNYIWFVGCEGVNKGGADYGYISVVDENDNNLKFDISKTKNIILLVLVIITSLLLIYFNHLNIAGFIWFILGLMLLFSNNNFIFSSLISITGVLMVIIDKK